MVEIATDKVYRKIIRKSIPRMLTMDGFIM